MIRAKVIQLNPGRLEKIQHELGYITSDQFFRTIPLADFQQNLEDFLQDHSPKGAPSDYMRFRASIGDVMHEGKFLKFAESWRIKREAGTNRISYKIWNLLETIGGHRGEAKFQSIEYGSSTTNWIVRKTFRIKIKGDWITLAKGRSVEHKGNEGAHVQAKVSDYILNVIKPKVATRVHDTVAKRLQ